MAPEVSDGLFEHTGEYLQEFSEGLRSCSDGELVEILNTFSRSFSCLRGTASLRGLPGLPFICFHRAQEFKGE